MKPLRIFAVVALAIVVIGGALFAERWYDRGPSRPSFGNAIDRFRTSSSVATPSIALQPKPGVYVYDGRGEEHLSFLNTHQSQGPTEPGTVTTTSDGCWTFRLDYNSFHFQTWKRCSSGGMLVEFGGTTDQRFDFVAFSQHEHSSVTCSPPMTLINPNAAAETRRVRCTGHSDTTGTNIKQTGTIVTLRRGTVRVGDRDVDATRVREDFRISGDQDGTVLIDVWFGAHDGLPLRESHDINVVSPAPSPINHVTYSEHGTWSLRSLTPRT